MEHNRFIGMDVHKASISVLPDPVWMIMAHRGRQEGLHNPTIKAILDGE